MNNVVYVRYAESARVNWAANYATTLDPSNKTKWQELWSNKGVGMILRSIKTDFKFVSMRGRRYNHHDADDRQPMTYPDRVTVFHKLRSMPEPSHDAFILDVLMFSERQRRPVARCVEDIVMYDYRKGAKTTLEATPFALKAFQDTFALQEAAAIINRGRARSIEDRVRILEQSSWDRNGAVDDTGGSKT